MTRQFDAATNSLIKLVYTFMQNEGVRSHYEAMHILNCVQDRLNEDYMLARSIQAGAAGIKRIREEEKDN